MCDINFFVLIFSVRIASKQNIFNSHKKIILKRFHSAFATKYDFLWQKSMEKNINKKGITMKNIITPTNTHIYKSLKDLQSGDLLVKSVLKVALHAKYLYSP